MGEYYGSVVGNSVLIRKYEKAQKDEKHLYLFVKIARADYENIDIENKFTLKVYKDASAKEVLMDTTKALEYYNNNKSKSFTDSIYDTYKDQMSSYKVTYKMSGAHYVLESVEPVK